MGFSMSAAYGRRSIQTNCKIINHLIVKITSETNSLCVLRQVFIKKI